MKKAYLKQFLQGLEDLCVQYDNTVRNCNNMVIQFCYGEDGLDPTYMEGKFYFDLKKISNLFMIYFCR